MRPAAAARKTFAAFVAGLIAVGRAIHLRLRAGDERRQAIDADAVGNHRLRLGLRLILRRRAMVAIAVVFAGLLLARLVGLALALVVARHERLRLRRNEAGLLAEM